MTSKVLKAFIRGIVIIGTGKCKINNVMLFTENSAINMSRLIPSLAQSFVRLHYIEYSQKDSIGILQAIKKVHAYTLELLFFCISTCQLI